MNPAGLAVKHFLWSTVPMRYAGIMGDVMENKLLLSAEEAASRLGVGRTTIFELLAAGDLQSLKIGRRRLIPVAALAAFVQRMSTAEPADQLMPTDGRRSNATRG